MRKGTVLFLLLAVVLTLPAVISAETEIIVKKECKSSCKADDVQFDKALSMKLEKMALELKLANIDLIAEKDKLHEELMNEFLQDKPSKKKIDKLSSGMLAADAGMMNNKMAYMMDVRKMLTPDQWKVFLKHHKASCKSGDKACCSAGAGCSHGGGKMCCTSGKGCSMGGSGHKCKSGCSGPGKEVHKQKMNIKSCTCDGCKSGKGCLHAKTGQKCKSESGCKGIHVECEETVCPETGRKKIIKKVIRKEVEEEAGDK